MLLRVNRRHATTRSCLVQAQSAVAQHPIFARWHLEREWRPCRVVCADIASRKLPGWLHDAFIGKSSVALPREARASNDFNYLQKQGRQPIRDPIGTVRIACRPARSAAGDHRLLHRAGHLRVPLNSALRPSGPRRLSGERLGSGRGADGTHEKAAARRFGIPDPC